MKERHLIQGYDGITVVWVDDRVLVERDDLEKLTSIGVQADSASCMDEAWFTAVVGQDIAAIDGMVIAEQQKYATIALGLMEVCEEYNLNLILVDFERAHDRWFRSPNAIFLLDIQNLMKPLGRFFQNEKIEDANWDWDLYGLYCAVEYGMPISRFRFLTRFRTQIAGNLPTWANPPFSDYREFEETAVLLDANVTVVKQRIRKFIQGNLLHEDRHITEMLLWFSSLPLTEDGEANHTRVLGDEDVLARITRKFNTPGTKPDSAKALALGYGNWPVCRSESDSYSLQVSVFLGVLNSLGLAEVQPEGLSITDWLRLPCVPGLPMLFALKALTHEMDQCPRYFGPTAITIALIRRIGLPSEYCIRLFLAEKDRDGSAVDMTAFVKSFKEWDTAERPPSERHQTRQRIGDLLRCKLTVKGGYSPPGKPLFLSGADSDVLRVEFNENPSRIEFYWEAQP